MNTDKKQWFSHKDFTSLEIQKHKSISEHDIVASAIITDVDIVKSFIKKIQKLPTEGNEYISFGEDAEHIDMIFKSDQGQDAIEIYNHMFKTPATSFNGFDNPDEVALYEEVSRYLDNNN